MWVAQKGGAVTADDTIRAGYANISFSSPTFTPNPAHTHTHTHIIELFCCTLPAR